jgi:heat shock protein HslJ
MKMVSLNLHKLCLITIPIISIFGLSMAACQPGTGTASPQQPSEAPTEQPAASAPSLTGPVWRWVSFADPLQSFEIDEPDHYTLQFNLDSTVNIKADCNTAIGNYTLDGQSIQIELGPMTKAACPPDSRSEKYLQYLSAAAIHFFEGDELLIDLKMDSGTMRFSQ